MNDVLLIAILVLLALLLLLLVWVGLAWAGYARSREQAVWNYRIDQVSDVGYFMTSPLPRNGWRIVAVMPKWNSLDLLVVWGRQS